MTSQSPQLSKLEIVDNIRKVWPTEAADFTPWLADSIELLGDTLGMDLELERTEASVGGYSLDILARDLNVNRKVVIENQLERTDHGHLGKLLTYAAGFDTYAVVWLTKEFRDEHRQALDWLNQRTGEDTLFFGVVIELFKIGDSLPAPHFDIVAAPNEWQKESVARATQTDDDDVSPKGKRYRAFFQELIDNLRENHQFTKAKIGRAQNWYGFSSGSTSFSYEVTFAQNSNIRVCLYIDTPDSKRNLEIFDALQMRKEPIESSLRYKLDWERMDDSRACRIAIYRDGSIMDDADTLNEIHSWAVCKLLDFKKVFTPHILELKR